MKKEEIKKIIETAKDLKVLPIMTEMMAFADNSGIHFHAVSQDFRNHAWLVIDKEGNVTDNGCDNVFAWINDMTTEFWDFADDALKALSYLSGTTQKRTAWIRKQAVALAN